MTYPMYSEITIYRNIRLLPENNFVVDDIDTYLSSAYYDTYDERDKIQITQAQFFKHSLKTTLKLDVEQISRYMQNSGIVLGNFNIYQNWNYARINNWKPAGLVPRLETDSVYYFITGKKWLSQNVIEFELEMDVLNTFDGLYELSPKTTILRQHKDRWHRVGVTNTCYPDVDLYSEGIPTTLFKQKEERILARTPNNRFDENNYYLVYRNQSSGDNAKVETFLTSDIPLKVDFGSSGFNGIIDPKKQLKHRIGDDDGLWIYGQDTYNSHTNVGAVIEVKDVKGSSGAVNVIIEITSANMCVVIFPFEVYVLTITSSGYLIQDTYYHKGNTRFREVVLRNVYNARLYADTFNSSSGSYPNDNSVLNYPIYQPIRDQQSYIGVKPTSVITDIDRTDPLLLKIVKLPYSPIPLERGTNADEILLPAGWVVATDVQTDVDLLKYSGEISVTAFIHTDILCWTDAYATDEIVRPLKKIQPKSWPTSVIHHNDTKDISYETKLFHSDYYVPTFVYDSFSYQFHLEYYVATARRPDALSINFYVSSAITSKMMFSFKNMDFSENNVIDTNNYSNILLVDRNNEIPIYNSAYVNYIKTGYNYDIKTRNRQLRSNIIGGSLSVAGAVASYMSSVYTGGLGIVSGTALATTGISKIYNAISDTAQADQNIAQKLRNAELQGISVAGADDIDLMTEYTTNNKAKMVYYYVSEKMEKCLYDLFFYYGYIANYQGIPNTTSRINFNYVQADVVFKLAPNISQEYLDEIAKKYKNGITFFHMYDHTIQGETIKEWDFEQLFENWETSLM